MADQAVEIVPYDPSWPKRFDDEARLLVAQLGILLVGRPEHIGSTAVPGMAAKPIIDIMAAVPTLDDSGAAIAASSTLGYQYYPYKSEAMHWFCKPSPAYRTHHLQLVPRGSSLWHDRIAFRDALRASLPLRTEYAVLKLALAERFRTDRQGYTDAKGAFIERVLRS